MCLAEEMARCNARVRARRRHFQRVEIMIRTLQAMPLVTATALLALVIVQRWS